MDEAKIEEILHERKVKRVAIIKAAREIDYILAKFHFPKEDKIEILKALSEGYETVETYEPLYKFATNKRLLEKEI